MTTPAAPRPTTPAAWHPTRWYVSPATDAAGERFVCLLLDDHVIALPAELARAIGGELVDAAHAVDGGAQWAPGPHLIDPALGPNGGR